MLRRVSKAFWTPETPGFEQKLQEMWDECRKGLWVWILADLPCFFEN